MNAIDLGIKIDKKIGKQDKEDRRRKIISQKIDTGSNHK